MPDAAQAGSDGGGTGAGAAGAGAGAAAAPAAQPAQAGGAGAGQGAQPQQGGIEQLRSAYDNIKKEFEPFQKLGIKPDQITGYQGVYQKTFEQVAAIGRQLGYPDDEIVEALQEDPVATLDYLRREFQAAQQGQQRQGDADLSDRVSRAVEEAVAPVQEWQNRQMTEQANALFERTTYQMATELYKQEGIDVAQVPQDELTLLLSATSEILKYDDDALKALKYEGKTAAIQKAFTEAKTMLDKYYLARSGRSGGVRPAAAGGGVQRGPNGQFVPGQRQDGKKATLDDLINNPELVNPKYAEGR